METEIKKPSTEERISSFAQTLTRNTAQIKADRGQEIAELTEVEAKRRIEDLERELKSLERRKKSSLDLSPDNTYSIMKVKDFEPTDFINKYNELGLDIRETKVRLNNSKQTYNELFGITYQLEPIV